MVATIVALLLLGAVARARATCLAACRPACEPACVLQHAVSECCGAGSPTTCAPTCMMCDHVDAAGLEWAVNNMESVDTCGSTLLTEACPHTCLEGHAGGSVTCAAPDFAAGVAMAHFEIDPCVGT